jgi:peptidoglycan hydrolase CwlO-like protein
MNRARRFFASFLFLLSLPLFIPSLAFAQNSNDQQVVDLQKQIAQYQAQLKTLGSQKQTLQSAIQSLDVQRAEITAKIKLTQSKIADANKTLKGLASDIGDKEDAISLEKSGVAGSLRDVAFLDDHPLVSAIFSSESLGDAWAAADADASLATNLQDHTQQLSSAKTVLVNTQTKVSTAKQELSNLNADLTSQQKDLDASKKRKQALLAQTQNSEANYQKLLASAQAELASFTAFTAGGTALGTQTVCDSWGCYYNQRDSTWGSLPLNGTKYSILSAGCLVTSMAMVMTHYGYKNVTPVTINSNPSNFAAYYPAFLLNTIYVGGISATRVVSTIDATLGSGNPVIVGLHAYGGTHFVVLTSGAKGSYLMRDPWITGGKDISFNAHYTIGSIYEVNKVVINK